MVDPLSVAGVAIGGVSLAFQVFDGCIKGFKFIVDASQMDKACAERRLSLIIEFHRLMDWGKEAGLVEKETGLDLTVSIQASRMEMVAIVSEISTLLQAFSDINRRYETLIDADNAEAEPKTENDAVARSVVQEVQGMVLKHEAIREQRAHLKGTNHIRKAAKNTTEFVKHPKRIVWTAIDKDAFDALLERLRLLTARLIEMMDNHQMREIEANVKKSYLNIVQLLDRSQDLHHLMQATLLFSARAAEGTGVDDHDDMLHKLALLKTLNQPYNRKGQTGTPSSTSIPSKAVKYTQEDAKKQWTIASYTPQAEQDAAAVKKRVWIEWKHYNTEVLDRSAKLQIHPGTLQRTSELSILLSHWKPDGFATPQCIGYFNENDEATAPIEEGRFGWIFEMPSSASETATPRSLLQLMSTLNRPSLTDRVALASRIAECVLYLHAVNWLHKALRSDNILYIFDGPGEPIWSSAIVSGFEYSRPDNSSTSENPNHFNPTSDIYRWPDIQAEITTERGSRKTYDIYALGLLLVEIAYWEPLVRVLKWGDINTVTLQQTQDVRKTMLNPTSGYLLEIEQRMGSKYRSVVETCLKGYEGFGLAKNTKENEPEAGLKLQKVYTESAVDVLKSIKV